MNSKEKKEVGQYVLTKDVFENPKAIYGYNINDPHYRALRLSIQKAALKSP